MRTLIILAAMIFCLASCATNPVTGRSQLMLVSEQYAIAASKEAYLGQLAPYGKRGQINSDPTLTARVLGITEKLVAQAITYRPETAHWDWEIKVIDDPETLNAWAMAGGKMAFYSGLAKTVNASDDEIAQVMGHEIAHALSAHTAEKMSVALASDLALTGLAVATEAKGLALGAGALAAALAIKLPNSRTAETEADRIGIELAAKAGYDPNAAVSLWEKMAKETSGGPPELLSTHPTSPSRIQALAALAPQMMPYYLDKGPRPVYKLSKR
ncbi:MAG: M48 family metallopeptidase [Gammaproteobacteria bacterium]